MRYGGIDLRDYGKCTTSGALGDEPGASHHQLRSCSSGTNAAGLGGIPLADPDFSVPDAVDLILGADAYGKLVRSQIRRGSPEEPIAQNTIFGWAIFGPCNEAHNSSGWVQHAAVDHGFQALQDLLAQFWVQEEVPVQFGSDLTTEEQECEAHFVATHSRDNSGRYIVRLPLRSSTIQLGQSFHTAHACLNRLVRKLDRDSHYKGLYDTFLGEYESLGHMSRVRDDEVGRDRVYYLPHHGVLTTKLRVVFNGSCNTDSGTSLNDLMHTGAKLQKDISDVLLWARRHRFIFATDIVKMFRQIRVHRDDWDLQRILWVDENGNTAHYHLTTVIYGTRSAPFLAVRVLLQLVADEGEKYPAAVAPLTMGRYVDDIYGGADQVSELLTQARHLIGICTAGGFPLAKWQSNSPALLTNLGFGSSPEDSRSFDECETKVLGLAWFPGPDVFKFTSLPYTGEQSITKRVILSEIAQIYDPLGFLSPVVIRAKILLQRLWLEKLAWDDPVSTEVGKSWVTFRHDLAHVGNIAVPRWLNMTSDSAVEIHGFSDASQLAMGAVVYVRVTGPGKSTRTALVCSKTKVAPIKRLTIPRHAYMDHLSSFTMEGFRSESGILNSRAHSSGSMEIHSRAGQSGGLCFTGTNRLSARAISIMVERATLVSQIILTLANSFPRDGRFSGARRAARSYAHCLNATLTGLRPHSSVFLPHRAVENYFITFQGAYKPERCGSGFIGLTPHTGRPGTLTTILGQGNSRGLLRDGAQDSLGGSNASEVASIHTTYGVY
ncbi:uncharacterized protein [Venturia canescens]|uniref:uncharacterized protein n=1 Tax=Venturia canescens TaxID=32260 RepID=UPI001C9CF4FF|nr:uncharacterized protein LOC122416558 [Venturia canescens]